MYTWIWLHCLKNSPGSPFWWQNLRSVAYSILMTKSQKWCILDLLEPYWAQEKQFKKVILILYEQNWAIFITVQTYKFNKSAALFSFFHQMVLRFCKILYMQLSSCMRRYISLQCSLPFRQLRAAHRFQGVAPYQSCPRGWWDSDQANIQRQISNVFDRTKDTKKSLVEPAEWKVVLVASSYNHVHAEKNCPRK